MSSHLTRRGVVYNFQVRVPSDLVTLFGHSPFPAIDHGSMGSGLMVAACHKSPPSAWDEDRHAHLRAELDAFYARAYGLTRDELRYTLDPADVKGPDYPSETFRVLKEKEIRHQGEYRPRRLVLEALDRMKANCEFKAKGM